MTLYGSFRPAVRRKVFISYHHGNDQRWFDDFTKIFCDSLDVFFDNSLDRLVDSDDATYIDRKIREEFINGSSLTMVLCGAETWKRKHVDWEIHSTLSYQHALLGIALPTAMRDVNGIRVPSRLHENVSSGYAGWLPSWPADPSHLSREIESAITRSGRRELIRNSAAPMSRNLS